MSPWFFSILFVFSFLLFFSSSVVNWSFRGSYSPGLAGSSIYILRTPERGFFSGGITSWMKKKKKYTRCGGVYVGNSVTGGYTGIWSRCVAVLKKRKMAITSAKRPSTPNPPGDFMRVPIAKIPPEEFRNGSEKKKLFGFFKSPPPPQMTESSGGVPFFSEISL